MEKLEVAVAPLFSTRVGKVICQEPPTNLTFPFSCLFHRKKRKLIAQNVSVQHNKIEGGGRSVVRNFSPKFRVSLSKKLICYSSSGKLINSVLSCPSGRGGGRGASFWQPYPQGRTFASNVHTLRNGSGVINVGVDIFLFLSFFSFFHPVPVKKFSSPSQVCVCVCE